MDQRELHQELDEAIRMVVRDMLFAFQTAMPVQVVSYDPSEMTCTLQPLIRAYIPNQNGTSGFVQLPLLIHCPVIFPGGGDWVLTFPIQAGDEGLAIFSSRSIDNWWLAGGIQNQVELRAHDISDGFVIVGPRSKPRVVQDLNITGPELRSVDGTVKIGLSPTGIAITSPTAVTVTSPLTTITGDLVVEGIITGTVVPPE